MFVGAKIKNWRERERRKTELTGRNPLRRQWSELDCSAI